MENQDMQLHQLSSFINTNPPMLDGLKVTAQGI